VSPDDQPRTDPIEIDADRPGVDLGFEIDPEHRHGLLYEAAIEAEIETGRHEESEAEARRGVIVRLARITGGFTVLLLGLAAIPLPGPGWLIVGVGLAILARDFVWAERMLNIVRKRLPQDEDGSIPTKTWVMIAVATAGTVSLSIWWTMLR
jgi:uncharacterized protein (TIGR02611 family)